MSLSTIPTCYRCGAVFDRPVSTCGRCGSPQHANSLPVPVVLPPAASAPQNHSPAKAVLLTMLVLGGGHLYVGRPVAAVLLLLLDLALVSLCFTGLGAIVAIPTWMVAALIASISAYSSAKK